MSAELRRREFLKSLAAVTTALGVTVIGETWSGKVVKAANQIMNPITKSEIIDRKFPETIILKDPIATLNLEDLRDKKIRQLLNPEGKNNEETQKVGEQIIQLRKEALLRLAIGEVADNPSQLYKLPYLKFTDPDKNFTPPLLQALKSPNIAVVNSSMQSLIDLNPDFSQGQGNPLQTLHSLLNNREEVSHLTTNDLQTLSQKSIDELSSEILNGKSLGEINALLAFSKLKEAEKLALDNGISLSESQTYITSLETGMKDFSIIDIGGKKICMGIATNNALGGWADGKSETRFFVAKGEGDFSKMELQGFALDAEWLSRKCGKTIQNVWAPHLIYDKGKLLIYATAVEPNGNQTMFAVEIKDPEKITDPNSWTLLPLSVNSGNKKKEGLLVKPTNPGIQYSEDESNQSFRDPSITRLMVNNKNYYVLTYTATDTNSFTGLGYMIAREATGPWEDKGPLKIPFNFPKGAMLESSHIGFDKQGAFIAYSATANVSEAERGHNQIQLQSRVDKQGNLSSLEVSGVGHTVITREEGTFWATENIQSEIAGLGNSEIKIFKKS